MNFAIWKFMAYDKRKTSRQRKKTVTFSTGEHKCYLLKPASESNWRFKTFLSPKTHIRNTFIYIKYIFLKWQYLHNCFLRTQSIICSVCLLFRFCFSPLSFSCSSWMLRLFKMLLQHINSRLRNYVPIIILNSLLVVSAWTTFIKIEKKKRTKRKLRVRFS